MSQNHEDTQDPNNENVPTATNRVEKVHLLEGAETEPTGRTLHLVLGVEQHPSTQLWQVWISRTGTDLQVVSAHREREAADATIAEIKRIAALGELFDEEKVVGIVARLHEAGDGEPEPLSREMIRTIYRTIEATVWKQEQEREH
jgi:chorismate mutase